MSPVRSLSALSLTLGLLLAACSGGGSSTSGTTGTSTTGTVIRLTGSDTMVNLNQAWAENYKKARPDISIQVAGGGSGVGIAGLIDGTLDIAASSRDIEPEEVAKATQAAGAPPSTYAIGLDALAVFVHAANPIDAISIEELAEIYGDEGATTKWSQLGIRNTACPSDDIIRISRQNSSGTYAYFREVILGTAREFKLGSIDQSGSKDVVALVSRTPCAIGYSGMAYGMDGVRALQISRKKGEPSVAPSLATAIDKSYPIARPLYLYSHGTPTGPVKEFLDWTLGPDGQKIVQDLGFVPAPSPGTN